MASQIKHVAHDCTREKQPLPPVGTAPWRCVRTVPRTVPQRHPPVPSPPLVGDRCSTPESNRRRCMMYAFMSCIGQGKHILARCSFCDASSATEMAAANDIWSDPRNSRHPAESSRHSTSTGEPSHKHISEPCEAGASGSGTDEFGGPPEPTVKPIGFSTRCPSCARLFLPPWTTKKLLYSTHGPASKAPHVVQRSSETAGGSSRAASILHARPSDRCTGEKAKNRKHQRSTPHVPNSPQTAAAGTRLGKLAKRFPSTESGVVAPSG